MALNLFFFYKLTILLVTSYCGTLHTSVPSERRGQVVGVRTNNSDHSIEAVSRSNRCHAITSQDALPRLEALRIRNGRQLLERNVWAIHKTSIHGVSTLVAQENLVLGPERINIQLILTSESTLVSNRATHVGGLISVLNTPLKLRRAFKEACNKRRSNNNSTRTTMRGAVDVLRSHVDQSQHICIGLANMTRAEAQGALREVHDIHVGIY